MKIYYKTKLGTLYHGDALEILKQIPDESVDLIVTDPPYNSERFSWDKKTDEWQLKWLKEAKRVLKKGGSIYVFFAPLNMYVVEGFLRKEFKLKNILVWHHPNQYGAYMSYGKDRWKSTWQAILYAVKGDRAKHGKKISEYAYIKYGKAFDVMIYPEPRPKYHPAQKPLELIIKLIDCSSEENDVVLDPFLGSGTTAVACEILGRKWIGIEIEEKYCEIAKKRIQEINKKKTRTLEKLFSSCKN